MQRIANMVLAATLIGTPAFSQTPPVKLVTTIGMIADIAANVGGACVEVTALMGSGSDPHAYQATPSDVRALAGAELILYVDPALEARLAEVLAGFAARVPTLGLAAALDPALLRADPDAAGQIDPHLWMDVSLWAQTGPVIADAITAQRPDCAAKIDANLTRYTDQLAALHDWTKAAIASIPENARKLVTAHDAFEYFAAAYGMQASEAIEGISTATEASIADIREVAAFVVANRVPAVFVETTISPRTIEALVAEARAQGHDVTIGGALYSDAMGDDGTAQGTYIGMIRANTVTITQALGGVVPDWPDALADWAATWDIALD